MKVISKLKFKGGVIAIGSLLWDKSDIRSKWREDELDLSNRVLINLPIRYGRISKSRNCTFSMVFSKECKSPEKIGKGYFIPFKNQEIGIPEILNQAKKIITAEYNTEKKFNKFNWGWGCLGLSINPSLEKDEKRKKDAEFLIKTWEDKFDTRFDAEDYKVGDERPLITKNGVMDIDWQEILDKYDFVIGTLTKPNVNKYPSSKEIAIKMIVNESYEYFRQNRKMLISTFQDESIEKVLQELDESQFK